MPWYTQEIIIWFDTFFALLQVLKEWRKYAVKIHRSSSISIGLNKRQYSKGMVNKRML